MRSILQGAVLAIFAACALGRYLPPEIFVNASLSRESTNPSLIQSTATFSLADAPTFSSSSSLSLHGVSEKSDGNTNGLVITQSLGDSTNDDLWEKHINKGKSLMCAMQGTDAAVGWQVSDAWKPPSGASRWVNFNDMAVWYWFEAKFNADVCGMGTYWGLRTTFQALRVDPRSNRAGTGLQCFQILHENENVKFLDGTPRPPLEQSYTVDGKLYHVRDMAEERWYTRDY